jgi:Domain of unknown function (DUF4277)
MPGMRVECLDHLGIVAGICREIRLAEYLDALDGLSQQQVSVGTATVAMILNGLGFNNRLFYLVSQFFATMRAGDVPLFCQALDGNASDKASLVAAVAALAD